MPPHSLMLDIDFWPPPRARIPHGAIKCIPRGGEYDELAIEQRHLPMMVEFRKRALRELYWHAMAAAAHYRDFALRRHTFTLLSQFSGFAAFILDAGTRIFRAMFLMMLMMRHFTPFSVLLIYGDMTAGYALL